MCSHREQILCDGKIVCNACGHVFGPPAVDRLRSIAAKLGGVDTPDGLFLNGVADAIEHGDAMYELGGKTLVIARPNH